MRRSIAVFAVLALLVVSGAVSGVWKHRWASAGLAANATKVVQLPAAAGEWEGRDKPVNPREVEAAQAAAIGQRVYVNRRTGQVATVMMVFGRAGPVSVHTPDVCYAGNGFDPIGSANRFAVAGNQNDQFWHLRLKKRAAVPQLISVFYAWNDGGNWEASDNPRVEYAAEPALLKLYVVRERNADDDKDTDESTQDLLQALVPMLKSSVAEMNQAAR